jgi:hypothetical protein
MSALIVPAPFQHIDKTFKICVDINMWLIDRMAHASLRRKMDHDRKPMFRKQRTRGQTIREIGMYKTETRIFAQDIQPRLLKGWIIVTVETVETDHIAVFSQ